MVHYVNKTAKNGKPVWKIRYEREYIRKINGSAMELQRNTLPFDMKKSLNEQGYSFTNMFSIYINRKDQDDSSIKYGGMHSQFESKDIMYFNNV